MLHLYLGQIINLKSKENQNKFANASSVPNTKDFSIEGAVVPGHLLFSNKANAHAQQRPLLKGL